MPMGRRVFASVALSCVLLAAPAVAQAAGLKATQRALARQMRHAGRFSGALVVDLSTGRTVYSLRPGWRRLPASVEKLYTSSTALLQFGSAGRLDTTVLGDVGIAGDGTLAGNLYLRGGGDPTLSDASIAAIAAGLRAQGLRRITGGVIGDASFFDPFRGPPSTGLATSIDVGPLSGLDIDHGFDGRHFQKDPPGFAAHALGQALKRRGVRIALRSRASVTPSGAVPLLDWPSPAMADIVRLMNQPSDNFMAETLIKAIGARFGGVGSTAAGAAVVRDTVARLGVRPVVVDGSGLSRRDRTSPREVVSLLRTMLGLRSGTAFATSLAVAGHSGTLELRMRRTAASGRCAGKTGTLRDVSNLAGYCTTLSGERLAFAFLMNRINPLYAHVLQDRMTNAIAQYEPDSVASATKR
jgi:D-alanyl-D-alanine carboxypeptidase/D-alanyl-D-alanine-endopeptidase (penicillin-binding protein 4)